MVVHVKPSDLYDMGDEAEDYDASIETTQLVPPVSFGDLVASVSVGFSEEILVYVLCDALASSILYLKGNIYSKPSIIMN